jgi:hypothetical protein
MTASSKPWLVKKLCGAWLARLVCQELISPATMIGCPWLFRALTLRYAAEA